MSSLLAACQLLCKSVLFNSTATSELETYYYSHLSDKDTEAQRSHISLSPSVKGF